MGNDQPVFDVTKRKGAMPIIYISGVHEGVRYKDLQTHLTVSDPTISRRLEELDEVGLLERTSHDEIPPRVECSLTPLAEKLYGPLSELFEWAAERAETGHAPGQRNNHQQEQSQTCVYCDTANGSETDDDREALPWQTVDDLMIMVAKTHAMGIVVQVGVEEPIRYNEIKDRLDITTDTAISTRLDELQEAGLMDRRRYDEIPPRVEYSLTPTGHELAACLRPILEWGSTRHADQPTV